MKEILNHLFDNKYLSRKDAKNVLTQMALGKYNECQIASFLSVYIMRSITVDELKGFRDALLNLCISVDLSEFNPIDLCGTGGDNKNTFNISTLSSFVVAGAGYKVAKHGNYGVSSGCGSSNVLEYLGYQFTRDQDKLKKSIDEANICFLHAPLFNPAMKNVAPVRKKLGMKTFFNMLGPMVNPSFPKRQVVGVFSLNLARLYNYIYQSENKDYIVIHSLDGYDEISLTGDVKIIGSQGEQVLSPEQLGLKRLKAKQLSGGDTVEESAEIALNLLQNKATEAQIEAVVANSGMAIKCIKPEQSFETCFAEARESIESGNAYQSFKKLLEI